MTQRMKPEERMKGMSRHLLLLKTWTSLDCVEPFFVEVCQVESEHVFMFVEDLPLSQFYFKILEGY